MTPPPGPRELDRRSAVPLWSQLRDELLLRLEGGDFPDRFPGEMELVEVYGVSRHTVREALRRLRADGLIESSRGRSSVARPGVISQQLGAMYSLFQELEARGIEQRSELLVADRRSDEDAATRLGLSPRTKLVYLERLRLGGDEPIAWDRAWLEPKLAAPLLKLDFTHTGLYDEWQRTAGVRLTGGRERISAVVPTREQRNLLKMKRDEAAMLVERTGCLQEQPVEIRVTLVRGSRFSFSAEWESGKTYQVDVAGES
jgi:GntR family transcriptional regulator